MFKEQDEIIVLETNLDDCTGEILGYVMDKLLLAGAKDVFYTSIFMKKNRPAYMLTVLCKEDKVEELENIIFTETTSIGIRKRTEVRTILKRSFKEIETPYGLLKVKSVLTPIGERNYPEFEAAKLLSEKFNIPLTEVYKSVK
ncbi:MAG: nickel insertion protein [Anaerotignaceae bacterium]